MSARAVVGFRKSSLVEREVPERNQGGSVRYGTLADTPHGTDTAGLRLAGQHWRNGSLNGDHDIG